MIDGYGLADKRVTSAWQPAGWHLWEICERWEYYRVRFQRLERFRQAEWEYSGGHYRVTGCLLHDGGP